MIEVALLEHTVREELDQRVPRAMAVLRPLRVVIDNYPEGQVEEFDAPNFPDDPPRMGWRRVPFSRVLYIEGEDFREEPPRNFFRLAPGQEVRLRWAYLVRCVGVVKDQRTGQVVELHCTYDPQTRGGSPPDGRRVRGTLHWVSADRSLPAEVRLYDHLFLQPEPGDEEQAADFKAYLNPRSLERLTSCRVEASLAGAAPGSRYQFERQGYFCADLADCAPGRLVFNRTVPLRDSWARKEPGRPQE